ncbi:hypothetical protein DH2020_022829 [Rehmannia glutinosa]|uniref:BHLH domain-containing protein n=1 Tax=Rehmannia glutinosa TaxID=99300 RepID=A0ABR0W6Y0_REHGL
MEMEENLDEIFDLNPINILPDEILYSSDDQPLIFSNYCTSDQRILINTKPSSSAADDVENGINSNMKRVCTANRTPLQAQDHVMAERKRRQNLTRLFVSLSKVVPGLKKLDKVSVLEDAINHLKALQARVKVLEEQEIKESSKDASEDIDYKESSIITKKDDDTNESTASEIKARILNKHICPD